MNPYLDTPRIEGGAGLYRGLTKLTLLEMVVTYTALATRTALKKLDTLARRRHAAATEVIVIPPGLTRGPQRPLQCGRRSMM